MANDNYFFQTCPQVQIPPKKNLSTGGQKEAGVFSLVRRAATAGGAEADPRRSSSTKRPSPDQSPFGRQSPPRYARSAPPRGPGAGETTAQAHHFPGRARSSSAPYVHCNGNRPGQGSRGHHFRHVDGRRCVRCDRQRRVLPLAAGRSIRNGLEARARTTCRSRSSIRPHDLASTAGERLLAVRQRTGRRGYEAVHMIRKRAGKRAFIGRRRRAAACLYSVDLRN